MYRKGTSCRRSHSDRIIGAGRVGVVSSGRNGSLRKATAVRSPFHLSTAMPGNAGKNDRTSAPGTAPSQSRLGNEITALPTACWVILPGNNFQPYRTFQWPPQYCCHRRPSPGPHHSAKRNLLDSEAGSPTDPHSASCDIRGPSRRARHLLSLISPVIPQILRAGRHSSR